MDVSKANELGETICEKLKELYGKEYTFGLEGESDAEYLFLSEVGKDDYMILEVKFWSEETWEEEKIQARKEAEEYDAANPLVLPENVPPPRFSD